MILDRFFISGPIHKLMKRLRDIAEDKDDLSQRLAIDSSDQVAIISNTFDEIINFFDYSQFSKIIVTGV